MMIIAWIAFLWKRQLHRFTICILLALFFLTGCALHSTSRVPDTTQIISVNEKLTVQIYDSVTKLRAAYMYRGGNTRKIGKVVGFYSERDNTIHCLKWDFYTCGHELYHALQYKGKPSLMVDKGHKHFEEYNYTRQSERNK